MPDSYRGVALEDLVIDAVEWGPRATHHIQHRTDRYPTHPERNIEPEWATEAALDPARMLFLARPLPGKTSPESILVVGWSAGAMAVLKVWIVPKEPDGLSTGEWAGRSASEANDAATRRYQRELRSMGTGRDRKTT